MRTILFIVLISLLSLLQCGDSRVYLTTGFKVGDVTQNSAVIWTRCCAAPQPLPVRHERREGPFRHPLEFDEDMPVTEMDGAVAGAPGVLQISLISETDTLKSPLLTADAEHDYAVKFKFDALEPHTVYQVTVRAGSDPENMSAQLTGSFRTAPAPDQTASVLLTSASCQYFWDYDDPQRGFKIYDSMIKLNPDFFVQTGDFVYYDKPGPLAKTVAEARHCWHANNAWPALVEFYRQVPLYLQKDDHDMLMNDCYPGIEPYGELSFERALEIWDEQVPVIGKPYRTVRWGRDLQIWMVEGREFRSPNHIPDGPEKTIWGEEQKNWFIETVNASDAAFKILFSPTPVVGPDRDKKADNHANRAFAHEGNWLRSFMADQGNMFVVNGDRHWQYVSVDAETGLYEFSQGPSSDSHAQGWGVNDKRPEHRFLRVAGGFLAVSVQRQESVPTITFTHYDIEGEQTHQELFRAAN